MISFEVNDMTCGHCVSAITQALKAVDKEAAVQIDLGRQLVQIEPGELGPDDLGEAIRKAGYTPRLASASSVPAEARKASGCCGCR